MRKIDIRAVRAFCQPVFLRHHMRGLLSKHLRLQQIAHPQPAPRHLVFVRRSDSSRGRANFVRAPRTFRGFVQLPVIRKNQVRAVADVQPPLHLNARFRKRLDFRHQRRRIHHHACPDHRLLLRPQNPARNQLQHITVLPNDDRVPRVVPARHARDVIERSRKVVHHLAFALVAPLRPHHHHRFHSDSLLNHTSALQSLLRFYYFGKRQETAGTNRKLAPPPTQASSLLALSRQLLIPKTTHQMIVHHPGRLHQRVTNRRPHEPKSPLLQILAQRVRFHRLRRQAFVRLPRILLRPPTHKSPHVRVKRPKLFLHLQERLRISDRRRNLQPIPDNPRVPQQRPHFFLVIPRHFLRIEPVKHFPVPRPLPQNRVPTQSRLRALQYQKLKPRPLVVHGHAPFLIMIRNAQLIPRPGAANHFSFSFFRHNFPQALESELSTHANKKGVPHAVHDTPSRSFESCFTPGAGPAPW